jgi:hypothetical protein
MKLTNERIEVAIEDLKTVPTRCYSLDNKDGTIPKYSAISEESRNTILAALDACRWRDAETEPPEPCELVRDEYGDLVYMAQDGRWFYKTDVAEDEEMPRPKRWRPLPEWEE